MDIDIAWSGDKEFWEEAQSYDNNPCTWKYQEMVMITIITKKSTDNKKLKHDKFPHRTCSASTAD